MIAKRKDRYVIVTKENLLASDSQHSFFRNLRSFKTADRPKQFDVRLLFPGKTDQEISELLADYFTEVSREFDALSPDEIPVTHSKPLPLLAVHEVATRIKHFRKPVNGERRYFPRFDHQV